MGNSNTSIVEKLPGEVTLTLSPDTDVNDMCSQLTKHEFEVIAITPEGTQPCRVWVLDPSARLNVMCQARMLRATLEPTVVSKGKYKVMSDSPRTYFEARNWHLTFAEKGQKIIAISPPCWLKTKYVFVG